MHTFPVRASARGHLERAGTAPAGRGAGTVQPRREGGPRPVPVVPCDRGRLRGGGTCGGGPTGDLLVVPPVLPAPARA